MIGLELGLRQMWSPAPSPNFDVQYNLADQGSLFVGRDGTGGAPGDGDPVGLMLDVAQLKGRTATQYMAQNAITDPLTVPGHHMVALTDAARPTLRRDGPFWYLEPDGVDDIMVATPALDLGPTWSHVGLWMATASGGNAFAVHDDRSGIFLHGSNPENVRLRAWDQAAQGATLDLSSGNARGLHSWTIVQHGAASIQGGLDDDPFLSPLDPFTYPNNGLALFSREYDRAASPFKGRFYGGGWAKGVLEPFEMDAARRFTDGLADLTRKVAIVTDWNGGAAQLSRFVGRTTRIDAPSTLADMAIAVEAHGLQQQAVAVFEEARELNASQAITALNMIAAETAGSLLYLTPPPHHASGTPERTAWDADQSALVAEFGTAVIDTLSHMQANGDGSANDNADIAAGLWPRSLYNIPAHAMQFKGARVLSQLLWSTLRTEGLV